MRLENSIHKTAYTGEEMLTPRSSIDPLSKTMSKYMEFGLKTGAEYYPCFIHGWYYVWNDVYDLCVNLTFHGERRIGKSEEDLLIAAKEALGLEITSIPQLRALKTSLRGHVQVSMGAKERSRIGLVALMSRPVFKSVCLNNVLNS